MGEGDVKYHGLFTYMDCIIFGNIVSRNPSTMLFLNCILEIYAYFLTSKFIDKKVFSGIQDGISFKLLRYHVIISKIKTMGFILKPKCIPTININARPWSKGV